MAIEYQDLSGHSFHRVDLSGTRFSDVSLNGASIRHSVLQQVTMRGAEIVDTTIDDEAWGRNERLCLAIVDRACRLDPELARRGSELPDPGVPDDRAQRGVEPPPVRRARPRRP
jgi:hypothetical protein